MYLVRSGLYVLPVVFLVVGFVVLRFLYQHNLVNSSFSEFTDRSPIITSKILGKQRIDLDNESIPFRSDGISYGATVILQGFVESKEGSVLRIVKGDSQAVSVRLPDTGSLSIRCVEPIDCVCESCVLDDIVPGTLIEIFNTYDPINDENVLDQEPIISNVTIR